MSIVRKNSIEIVACPFVINIGSLSSNETCKDIFCCEIRFLFYQPKTSSEKQARALGGTPYTGKEILAQRKKENDDNLLMIEQFPMDGRLLEVLVVEGDLLLC